MCRDKSIPQEPGPAIICLQRIELPSHFLPGGLRPTFIAGGVQERRESQSADLFKVVLAAGKGDDKITRGADAADCSLAPLAVERGECMALGADGPCWGSLPCKRRLLLRRPDLLRHLQPAMEPIASQATLP